jgi:hypothetical protein
MTRVNRVSQCLLFVVVACGSTLLASATSDDLTVTPHSSDREAARSAKSGRHAMPAKTKGGSSLRSKMTPGKRAASGTLTAGQSQNQSRRYPADLQYHGGATLESIESHAIYMLPNGVCPISVCWGNPEGFLRDMGNSDFIHVVDQYVGLHADERYSVGSRAKVNFTPQTNPLTDNDMIAVVHAVALQTGKTGYGHMYHVFLPPGTDECFDSTYSVCYSPDNNDTWFFCAYHGYADFPDIGHVIYSVEPYQNVPGCSVKPGTPNGSLIDSTNSVLSHELIEAITDPDLDAWWNSENQDEYGAEIADECSFLTTDFYFDPAFVKLGSHRYAIQTEYSNSEHAYVVKN